MTGHLRMRNHARQYLRMQLFEALGGVELMDVLGPLLGQVPPELGEPLAAWLETAWTSGADSEMEVLLGAYSDLKDAIQESRESLAEAAETADLSRKRDLQTEALVCLLSLSD